MYIFQIIIYIYIHTHIHIYIYIYIHKRIHIYSRAEKWYTSATFLCTHTLALHKIADAIYIYTYIYIYVHICTHLHIYIYMDVYMYFQTWDVVHLGDFSWRHTLALYRIAAALYIHTYRYMYIYIYICIFKYVHIFQSRDVVHLGDFFVQTRFGSITDCSSPVYTYIYKCIYFIYIYTYMHVHTCISQSRDVVYLGDFFVQTHFGPVTDCNSSIYTCIHIHLYTYICI